MRKPYFFRAESIEMNLRVPPHIESLIPYPPGKPLEELEREYGAVKEKARDLREYL